MSDYASPDSFGSVPGVPTATNPADGLTYTLGFQGAPPVPVWILVSTWLRAKQRFGATWADAKRNASTWGVAKAIVGS
jgi:hypothetical protein